MPAPLYQLLDGVHRAVAARNAGLPGVLVRVYFDDGVRPPEYRVVAIDCLFATKPAVSRWDKGRDLAVLTADLQTAEGRAGLAAPPATPISDRQAGRMTCLTAIVVTEAEPEGGLP